VIVKCSHCKQIMSQANFYKHECDLPLKKTERIEVVYFRDDSYKDKKLMTGWGTDGVLYTFEVVPRKPLPIVMCNPTRVNMKGNSDEKLTEPRGEILINLTERLHHATS
jgi:hypothetical protein